MILIINWNNFHFTDSVFRYNNHNYTIDWKDQLYELSPSERLAVKELTTIRKIPAIVPVVINDTGVNIDSDAKIYESTEASAEASDSAEYYSMLLVKINKNWFWAYIIT